MSADRKGGAPAAETSRRRFLKDVGLASGEAVSAARSMAAASTRPASGLPEPAAGVPSPEQEARRAAARNSPGRTGATAGIEPG